MVKRRVDAQPAAETSEKKPRPARPQSSDQVPVPPVRVSEVAAPVDAPAAPQGDLPPGIPQIDDSESADVAIPRHDYTPGSHDAGV